MKDKIYYFQEKSNDILDLQDDFTSEEIGIYFILKAAYFKYAGEIKKDNICQRCKFFGDKTLLNKMIKILFEEQEGLLVNKSWLDDIRDIKERSKKRKEAAEQRWKKEKQKPNKNPRKPKETQSVNQDIYQELAEGLKFVLEAKLNRSIKITNWNKDIRLLITEDLKPRSSAIDDVKRCIQAIADHYGKEYFPTTLSAGSFRKKFTSIENYLARNNKSNLSYTNLQNIDLEK